MRLRFAFATAALLLVSAASMACVVDARSDDGRSGPSVVNPPGANPPPSTTPILVRLDTGKQMAAAPGDGVGVFTEYGAGGKWHIWWTCDTNRSNESCPFRIGVTAATGSISNANAEGFGTSDVVGTPSANRLQIATTTAATLTGITFDTDPGAVITLQASVSDLGNASLFFFVQDGKVNGGFSGNLTNPINLQGTAP